MATTSTYPNRSEMVFLYDIFRCNPNGDPFENRPRQDPVTGRIEVTDVRLKRTIRDYILNYKHDEKKEDGLEVFVRVVGEKALTAERRYEDIFKTLPTPDKKEEAKNALLKKCVDVRMFGALVPITKKAKAEKGAGVQLTGAVQFNPGQSLHEAEIIEVSGTGGFASEEGKQKTFRREFYVPYALIGFYGVINEAAAKETGLTEQDVNLLMEAMWNGTLFLHSRSKAFHHPRLLLRFDYKDQRQSGYLLESVKLSPVNGKEEKEIRSPKDYNLDIAPLFERVKKQDGFIEGVFCRYDDGFPHFSNLETTLKTYFGSLSDKLIIKKGQEL